MAAKYFAMITTRLQRLLTLTACELRICSSWRTELEIFNIQSEQQQERDDNSRLPKLLFVEVTHLGQTNALNACSEMTRVHYQHPPNPYNCNRASKIVYLF